MKGFDKSYAQNTYTATTATTLIKHNDEHQNEIILATSNKTKSNTNNYF